MLLKAFQQQMKLKESLSLNKKIYLPQLRTIASNQITPKNKPYNQSLPKILALNFGQMQSKELISHNRNAMYDRKPLKDRLKALYNKKRQHFHANTIESETSPKGRDHPGITNNFQKEIEKNLAHIKKVKQSNKKQTHKKESLLDRYHSTKITNQFSDEGMERYERSFRIGTEESVLHKINEIIMYSQAKTPSVGKQQKNLSLKSYKESNKSDQSRRSRKRITTEAIQTQNLRYKAKQYRCQIKHNQNYHEWRKLSIDSLSNPSPKYENTSYEIETDRLETIRSKNDLSIRKYFEGKEYLQKLISFRESALNDKKE